MAQTGIGVVVTTQTEIFSPADGGCTAFHVHCLTGSTSWVEIRVIGLHKPNEWFAIRQGRDAIFRLNHGQSGGVYKVLARGGDGNATEIDWGPVASTDRNDER